jgi:hypothetical protein
MQYFLLSILATAAAAKQKKERELASFLNNNTQHVNKLYI